MGWTFIDKPASADTYFRGQFADRYTVVDAATVNLTRFSTESVLSRMRHTSCCDDPIRISGAGNRRLLLGPSAQGRTDRTEPQTAVSRRL
jgi:hypothetical protein